MAFTTGSFLKAIGLDAIMNGGDVSETLSNLKNEMAEGLAKQTKPEAKKRPKKESPAEPEVIDTDGEEVKDATDFARKYGHR